MKTTKIILLAILFGFSLSTQAQVAINKDGSAPAATSILHVKGDDSGTALQAMFIESSTGNVGIGTINPETNLNIYSSADNNGLTLQTSDNTFMQGIRFRNSGGAYTWNIYRKDAGSNHADLVFANGFSTDLSTLTEVVTFKDGGSVGIGTTNPHASAALDISSTSRGFLPPRMTVSQMQSITTPAIGLCVFNTDVNALCTYNGSSWDCYDSQSLYDDLFVCGFTYTDRITGYQFSTVLIGDQCWMGENMNIGTQINSTNGGTNNDGEQTDNAIIEKYCYNNNASNCDTYGGLYQWNEMMQFETTEGVQGICPDGWHLPTDDEWKTMEMHLGMTQAQADAVEWRGTDEGGKMKEEGTVHWNSPNTGATNSSGFTGLPGGISFSDGSFSNLGNRGTWWSSSEGSDAAGRSRELKYDNNQVGRYKDYKTRGFSVRCLKN